MIVEDLAKTKDTSKIASMKAEIAAYDKKIKV
jgi:hypothetical protein